MYSLARLIRNLFLHLQIVGSNSEEQQKMFGRHFEMEDELVSHISRNSIDVLKTNYRVSTIQLCGLDFSWAKGVKSISHFTFAKFAGRSVY